LTVLNHFLYLAKLKRHGGNVSEPKPQKMSFEITCGLFVQVCMRINLQ